MRTDDRRGKVVLSEVRIEAFESVRSQAAQTHGHLFYRGSGRRHLDWPDQIEGSAAVNVRMGVKDASRSALTASLLSTTAVCSVQFPMSRATDKLHFFDISSAGSGTISSLLS
jgi:hypothetical protein